MRHINPYNPGTLKYQDFNLLSDLEWHCTCEFVSGQPAKPVQLMRHDGYEFEKRGNQWSLRAYCENCGRNTSHYRMLSTEPVNEPVTRSNIPSWLKARAKDLYQNVDQIDCHQLDPGKLEIDHRVPQVRWSSIEDSNETLHDEEIIHKFLVMSRSNNLRKSRECEHCVQTGERGYPFGIKFWYDGGEDWEFDDDDPQGCYGCFWYDPQSWRDSLNDLLGF